jgi:hypothetical protein
LEGSALDDEAARKMFQSYLTNAAAKSGMTLTAMHSALKKSGLTKHSDLRAYAMKRFGLGHGHAQAVVVRFLKPEFRTPAEKRIRPKSSAGK